MALKHKYELEKLQMKVSDDVIDAQDLVEYSVEDITRALKKAEEA